ncbi:hypothetical protein GQ54DRAFT_168526 [Martensiomyces pterosporus]|nr:hypothetical protein GQ54DRAFT_168526 [Martensiomyces pterosporus]
MSSRKRMSLPAPPRRKSGALATTPLDKHTPSSSRGHYPQASASGNTDLPQARTLPVPHMALSPTSSIGGPGRIRRGLSKLEELFWAGSSLQRAKLKQKSQSDAPEHYSAGKQPLSPQSPTNAIGGGARGRGFAGEDVHGHRGQPALPIVHLSGSVGARNSGRERTGVGLGISRVPFARRFRSSSSSPAAFAAKSRGSANAHIAAATLNAAVSSTGNSSRIRPPNTPSTQIPAHSIPTAKMASQQPQEQSRTHSRRSLGIDHRAPAPRAHSNVSPPRSHERELPLPPPRSPEAPTGLRARSRTINSSTSPPPNTHQQQRPMASSQIPVPTKAPPPWAPPDTQQGQQRPLQNGTSLLFQRQMSKMQSSRARERMTLRQNSNSHTHTPAAGAMDAASRRYKQTQDVSEFPTIANQQPASRLPRASSIPTSELRVRSKTFAGQTAFASGDMLGDIPEEQQQQQQQRYEEQPSSRVDAYSLQPPFDSGAPRHLFTPKRRSAVASNGRGAFSEARVRTAAERDSVTPVRRDDAEHGENKRATPGSGSSAGSHGDLAMRQRSKTVQPSPTIYKPDRLRGVGYMSPDPTMPVEECSERIDKLLQRVQQTHREYTARQALTSPKTPTRFDSLPLPRAAVGAETRRERRATSSTVSTISLGSDSSCGNDGSGIARQPVAASIVTPDEAEALYRQKRRAATMDPAMSERTSASIADSASVRGAASTQEAKSVQRRTTTAEVRMKLEKLRARRAARLEAQAAAAETSSPQVASKAQFESGADSTKLRPHMTSPGNRAASGLSGSTYLGNDDADFFDNGEVVTMFQEIPLPLKDIEWDKRVYYYHVAQKNEAYRKATEEAEIGDYREECLVDLLGEKVAAKVISKTAPLHDSGGSMSATETVHGLNSSSGEHDGSDDLSSDDIDAIAAWMDEEDDLSGDDDCSFDWSRDGFGYMEFRRLSRASIASSSILSPTNEAGDGLAKLHAAAAAAAAASPSANATPGGRAGAVGGFASSHATDSQAPSPSLMGATNSSSAWSLSPMTARTAASNFNDAISSATAPRTGRDPFSHLPGSTGRSLLSARRSGLGVRTPQQGQRPASMYSDFMHALSRITESSNLDDSDGSWQMLGHDDGEKEEVKDEQRVKSGRRGQQPAGEDLPESDASTSAAKKAQLGYIRSENEQLKAEIESARQAIAALTRLVVRI